MTDRERYEHIRLKATLTDMLPNWQARLRAVSAIIYGTDSRIFDYCAEVLLNPDAHNLYEMLGVTRFIRMLETYEWNAKRVRRFFKFYERLRFSGTGGRSSYKLTPVQCFQFANIFGFQNPDGTRMTRVAYIFVPRKFSKTTSAAALAVWDFLFGDSNAQAYVGANSYKQAKICFDEIRKIMGDIDPHGRHIRINRETIFFTDGTRDSSVSCLTANARTLDGLNASLVIMDEYAQARNTATRYGADLKNVLTSSMGARREPLTVIITTASEVLDGPFAHEIESVKAMLRGDRDDMPGVFASIFCPDADDAEDDPRTWAKVQPHLGVTVQPGYYAQAWADAQLSGENMMVFRTKLLNIFAVNDDRVWLTDDEVRASSADFTLRDWSPKTVATMSVDLSEDNDFTAVGTAVHDPVARRRYFHVQYFIPEVLLERHPNRRAYQEWVNAGYLKVTAGNVVDYRAIADYIFETAKHLRVVRLGYDAWRADDLINLLRNTGARKYLMPVKQSYGTFTAPVDTMTRGIRSQVMIIHNNPINFFGFGNVVIDEDRNGNRKPIKRSANFKIDGIVTMLMCQRLFLDLNVK